MTEEGGTSVVAGQSPVDALPPGALGGRAIQGVAWTAGAQAVAHLVQFVVLVVLTRLVSPQEFGIVTTASIFITFVGMAADLGLGAAILQQVQDDPGRTSAFFWFSLGVSAVLVLVCCAVSPLVARLFDARALTLLMSVASVRIMVDAVGTVQRVVLKREIEFRSLALAETWAVLFSGAVAIACAAAGLGAWSLVIGSLVRSSVNSAVLWGSSPWRPTWRCSLRGVWPLAGFGASVIGNNMVNYVQHNLDNFVVGRWLGLGPLGFYGLAYSLAHLATERIAPVVSYVAFPVLSRVQRDQVRFRSGYLASLRLVSVVSFPVTIGLLLLADPLVVVLYGERWRPMIPALRILCCAGLLSSVGTLVGPVYMSRGQPHVELAINVFLLALRAVLIPLAVTWGLEGVAAAMVGSGVVGMMVQQRFANRIAGVSWREVGAALRPAAGVTVAMGGVVIVARWAQQAVGPVAASTLLLELVAVGVATYVSVMRATQSAVWQEGRRLVLLVLGRASGGSRE